MKNDKLSNEQISGLCMELSLLLHAGVRAGDGLALLAEESRGDDRAWLEAFSAEFVANLPRGGNDSRGNWIRVRAQRATFGRSPDKRVGEKVIEVFTRVNRLFVLTFTGRITGEELAELIPSLTITTCIRQQGEDPYGDEKECGRGTGRAG